MYFLKRTQQKKMEEGAGKLHAEGVDPGMRCEGNTPVSIRGTTQECLPPIICIRNPSKHVMLSEKLI